MADDDIWQQLSRLTKKQFGAVRTFLTPSSKTTKKSTKPKDQGQNPEKAKPKKKTEDQS